MANQWRAMAALCTLCAEAGCSKNDPRCAIEHAIVRLQQRLQAQAQEAAVHKDANRKASPPVKKVV
jgi:Ser/Thr protein kinase RdoA (MazF antagonist)